jgi:hypothetical protein
MTVKKPTLPPRPAGGRKSAPPPSRTLVDLAPDSLSTTEVVSMSTMEVVSLSTTEIASPFVETSEHTLVDGASHLRDEDVSDASHLFMPSARPPARSEAPPELRPRFETADSFEPAAMTTSEDVIWRPNSDRPPGSLPSAPWPVLKPSEPSKASVEPLARSASPNKVVLLAAIGVVLLALFASIAFLLRS